MRDYLKINKNLAIVIQKNYKLNCDANKLIADLEKYYSQKKRFKFLNKNDSFIIKKRFSFFAFRITDRWNVALECNYTVINETIELTLTSKIFHTLYLFSILLVPNIYIIVVSKFDAPILAYLIITLIVGLSFIPNIITKYKACNETIKEFEKTLYKNDN